MLRNLTTRANRRQGFALALSLLGIGAVPESEAKKKKKKKLELGDICKYSGQCEPVNAICALSACNTGDTKCCRQRGETCSGHCDCCLKDGEGRSMRCAWGNCERMP